VWDKEKNKRLKSERGISFEQVARIVKTSKVLDSINNPNKKRYPNQKVFIININEYVYAVPYVEDKKKYFLKTIFPSRKLSKKYLKKEKNDEKI
jgi:uncharacterized DUF497 family protein